jgi:DNA invertase Pin-like site-specific DNA recombinase
MLSSIKTNKPTAIVFCRISRIPDEENGIMSLSSQEYAILRSLETRGENVYTTLKTVGSAYTVCVPQEQLLGILRHSRHKTVYVYEPNRLSRNTEVFDQIWTICKKQKHKIFVITMNRLFDSQNDLDYTNLQSEIVRAQTESYEMGRRISRTVQYKKSREPEWGYMRDDHDLIVPCQKERQISNLIRLLGTKDSLVSEITQLLHICGNTVGKEAFSLVEYSLSTYEELKVTKLPYGMGTKNIADTLKYYEVSRRGRLNWKISEIFAILNEKPITTPSRKRMRGYDTGMDDLANDFEILGKTNERRVPETPNHANQPSWIYLWYDPAIGLPPNVKLPDGMSLPSTPCELVIPKL